MGGACKPGISDSQAGKDSGANDTQSSDTDPGGDCTSPMGVTWDNWGSGFFQTYCNTCHSSETQIRHGAPVGVDFDSQFVAALYAERISVRVIEEETMPLGGGVQPDALVLLADLLVCLESGEEAEDTDTENADPEWTASDVETAIGAALAHGFPDPYTPRDAYISMFSGRDNQCPADSDYSLNGSFNGCVSSTGYLFAGTSDYEGPLAGQKGPFYLVGDCYIVDDADQWFVGGGDLKVERASGPGTWPEVVTGTLMGSWSYDGSSGWLGEGSTQSLWITSESQISTWELELNGGFSTGAHHVSFSGLRFDSASCGGHATGTLSVRSPVGQWYDLDFGAGCDGCGTTTWQGQEIGEACVDLRDHAEALHETMRLFD
jgi:hypothetical protein